MKRRAWGFVLPANERLKLSMLLGAIGFFTWIGICGFGVSTILVLSYLK